MGYFIKETSVWSNGKIINANYVEAIIIKDNLKDFAKFLWILSFVTVDNGEETKELITQGNITISGPYYDTWGQSSDVNLAAYEYICSKINLTIQP